jgi:acetyltransferase-like isoleucine patch superfamily enzyme
VLGSTVGRLYWALKFTWLGSGVRIDSMRRVRLGKSVFLDKGVILEAWDGYLHIGNRVYIGCYSVIIGSGGVKIGSNVLMGAHCVITSANHRFSDRNIIIWEQGMSPGQVTIGEDVWLGANVKVMPGVSIGNGAVVGAGSVVTKNIADYHIAMGVPAKIVGSRK